MSTMVITVVIYRTHHIVTVVIKQSGHVITMVVTMVFMVLTIISPFLSFLSRAENNTAQIPCDCDDPELEDDEDPTDNDKVFTAIMSDSHCVSTKNWLTGPRSDICNDKHPQTPEEREQEIRDEVKKDWTIYLIVGVLVINWKRIKTMQFPKHLFMY